MERLGQIKSVEPYQNKFTEWMPNKNFYKLDRYFS